MSWTDSLKGAVGGLMAQAEGAALPELVKGLLGAEGLQTILGKLKDAGLDRQVTSWLDGAKANLPVSPDQLRAALGDEHVQQLARSLGLPVDAVLAALAEHLPQAASAAGPAAAPPASDDPSLSV